MFSHSAVIEDSSVYLGVYICFPLCLLLKESKNPNGNNTLNQSNIICCGSSRLAERLAQLRQIINRFTISVVSAQIYQ